MRKPSHLTQSAYSKFEELVGIVGPNLREGDENLLAVLANLYADYRKVYDEWYARPSTVAGERMTRKSPLFEMKDTIEKRIESLSRHFGLSPWSRGAKLDKVKETGDELDSI